MKRGMSYNQATKELANEVASCIENSNKEKAKIKNKSASEIFKEDFEKRTHG